MVGWMYQVEVYLRVRKMTAYSVPPGYRRQNPPKRPKLEPFTGISMQEAQVLADTLEGNLSVRNLGGANVRPELVEIMS